MPNMVTTINNNKLNVAIIVLQEKDDRRGDDRRLVCGGISDYTLSFVNVGTFQYGRRKAKFVQKACSLIFLVFIIPSLNDRDVFLKINGEDTPCRYKYLKWHYYTSFFFLIVLRQPVLRKS